MTAYCDTSILLALASEEPGWIALTKWLSEFPERPLVSSFGWGEVVDAVARKLRRGEIARGREEEWFASAQQSFSRWDWIEVTNDDVVRATGYIRALPLRALKLPDAIHLAMAERLKATLLTGDRRQATIGAELNVATHLILADPET